MIHVRLIRLGALSLAAVLLAAAGPPRASPAARPAASPAPAEASATPPLLPLYDAVVAYHLRPAVGEAFDLHVIYRAGGTALRIDLPDQSYMLATPATRALVLVVPSARTAAEMAWADGPQSLFVLDGRMKFSRKGEATIAGRRCTQWEAVNDPARHQVCVTNEGLLLRQQYQDAQGRRSLVDAFALRVEPMAETDFMVPPGFERMSAGAPADPLPTLVPGSAP